MHQKLNVLWLPGWFPSKVDFLSGDFTERHAKAVSSLVNVTAIFVVRALHPVIPDNKIEVEEVGGLKIYRAYYFCGKKNKWLNKLYSVSKYYKLLFKLYKIALSEKKNFHLVHVHIALKQGLMAVWFKWKYGIKYVLTEQNGWYMPKGDFFFSQSFLIRYITKKIFKKASAIHVVSDSLGKELIKRNVMNTPYTVIPNVVDTSLFKPSASSQSENNSHFVTITGNIYQKNTDGLIYAFSSCIHKGLNAILHIIGPNTEQLKQLVVHLNISDKVIFYGAIQNEEVAHIMQRCCALVFFTRYETFGCVMAEALCCGIPVIASRLPVLEENLVQQQNALFVKPEDTSNLADVLIHFIENKDMFDREKIATEAHLKYNYSAVAHQIKELYDCVLSTERK